MSCIRVSFKHVVQPRETMDFWSSWLYLRSRFLSLLLQWNLMTKSNLGRKVYWLTPPGHMREIRLVTQGRNLKAEAEAEDMEECCLAACSPWFDHLAFIYYPGPPAHGWNWAQWPGTSYIISVNKTNFPKRCGHRSVWSGKSLICDSFFSGDSWLNGLTMKTNQNDLALLKQESKLRTSSRLAKNSTSLESFVFIQRKHTLWLRTLSRLARNSTSLKPFTFIQRKHTLWNMSFNVLNMQKCWVSTLKYQPPNLSLSLFM